MRLKSRLISFLLITIFFSLVFRGTVFASDFKVTGTAIDSKNNPVVNAKITVKDALTQQVITTGISDKNGYYSLSVPEGTYNITTIPPLGSKLQMTSYSHITITSDISLRNNLNTADHTPSTSINGYSQASVSQNKPRSATTILVVLFVVMILILVVALFMWKKKTPSSTTTH